MKLCVVSSKECWRDSTGHWWSSGGFPLQMEAVASLFDEATLVITEVPPRSGGLPLPARATVVPLRRPTGHDLRRKVSLALRFPYYWRSIWRAVGPADAVHTPLPGDLPALGMAVALLRRRRLLARYGGAWQDNSQSTPWGRRIRRAMRSLAGGRRVMLATGEGSEPPAPGMHWIFATALSGRELSAHRPDLDRVPSAPARLVSIGRLSAEKGVAVLLQAVERLARSGIDIRLELAGDGPQRASLEAQARKSGLTGRVTFAGQLDREGLRRLLDRSDVCVQASLTEGFSKAWLDAMSAGLPVVTSNVGAASCVIGGGEERGWLVAPGDPDALAAKLRAVLTEPRDWPALRRRCREYVEGRTLENWARRIGELCSRQWGVPFDGRRLG